MSTFYAIWFFDYMLRNNRLKYNNRQVIINLTCNFQMVMPQLGKRLRLYSRSAVHHIETFHLKLKGDPYLEFIHLPVYITGSGRTRVVEQLSSINDRSDYTLLQCESGAGQIVLSDRTIKLEEGMLLLYPPQSALRIETLRNSWQSKWFSFNGFELSGIMRTLQLEETVVLPLHDGIIKILFDEIILNLNSQGQDQKFENSALLYTLLVKVWKSRALPKPERRRNKENKLETAVLLMYDRYAENLPLSELAEHIELSEQHLNRLFRKRYGMTATHFLTRLRLQKAKEILASKAKMTCNEVAAAVGFNSPSYFGSIFKKYEACTPQQYRERMLQMNLC